MVGRKNGVDKATSIEEEKPFAGIKVYYSGSIKGLAEVESDFPWQLVQYMGKGGADVLSEHVAGRNQTEMDEISASRIGMEVEEMLKEPEPWYLIRKKDIEWVDEASHVVALVNAPSHGVGMEIQRAIDLMEFGIQDNKQLLCLVHQSIVEENKLSYMIRGIHPEKHPFCKIRSYIDLEDAKELVYEFLTK